MRKRKSIPRTKLKVVRKDECRSEKNVSRICFQTLLKSLINRRIYVVLTKFKNREAADLNEIHPEVWKTRTFDDLLFRFCNAVYKTNTIEQWTKGCILPFPKKSDLVITQNNKSITLTSIAAKVYNALFLNCIKPDIGKILRKYQNGFRKNRSTAAQILTIRRVIEGVRAKNLEATRLRLDFSRAFGSIHRRKSKYYKHMIFPKKLLQQ